MGYNELSQQEIEALRQFDTCTLSNALERLSPRLRNEGFINGDATCRFPGLPAVAGYAVTGKIRSSMPPVRGRCYYEHVEWWRYLAAVPAPRIVVMQDADHPCGLGALFGEVHARICKALRCVAYVTNGAVRDLPSIERMGFQLFSGGVSVSHAYAHVVDFSQPVEIGGLRIASGDLLHGDMHGVLSIPFEFARELPAMARRLRDEEQELFRLCAQKDFSVDTLATWLEHKSELQLCD